MFSPGGRACGFVSRSLHRAVTADGDPVTSDPLGPPGRRGFSASTREEMGARAALGAASESQPGPWAPVPEWGPLEAEVGTDKNQEKREIEKKKTNLMIKGRRT